MVSLLKNKNNFSFKHRFYLDLTIPADPTPCGDWDAYRDEKCLKIIDGTLRTYDDAIKTCQQQNGGSSLISIRSLEEQEFISNHLFKTHKVVDTVWIEAKYIINKFKWSDNSDLTFTNWVEGSPSNTIEKSCVQMVPEGSSMGKWVDEPCNKKNLVVCQKLQTWSLSRLQNALLDARKELQDSLEDVKKQLKDSEENTKQMKSSLEDAKNHINSLQQNTVPIGFIYIQLPDQPEPSALWSIMEWKDVSSEYAGLFFRVLGGASAAFGTTQNGDSPRLTNVRSSKSSANHEVTITPGNWTDPALISAGTSYTSGGGDWESLQFYVTSVETRPKNTAVRIWKRTK